MEQETKHKTKKAMAIAGIATLSAFALIGLFAIGALIGGCAEKKQPDTTVSEQVHTAHNLRRAGADVAADKPRRLNVDGVENYLDDAVSFPISSFNYTASEMSVDGREPRDFVALFVSLDDLPYGTYCLDYSHTTSYTGGGYFYANSYAYDFIERCSVVGIQGSVSQTTNAYWKYVAFGSSNSSFYFKHDGNLGYKYFAVVCGNLLPPQLYLVDALSIPASAVVTLPEDWNPTAWVSDEAIGGYPVVHGSYTTEANASGAYVRVGWANVVFKTASDSAVFTSLVVRYRWLWNGQKYRINDQTLTYAYSSENALLYPVSVSFLDPVTNTWTIVAKEAMDVIGGDYVHTGNLNWLYPTYRTLGFLEFPESPTSPTIRFYHSGEAGSGEATWQPTPTLQGLTFFDWFGLASWNSPQQVDVGTGNAIGLISTAFSGMLPILGISIFPNITLGLLLFLSLIGGIIVLIIKAVSK